MLWGVSSYTFKPLKYHNRTRSVQINSLVQIDSWLVQDNSLPHDATVLIMCSTRWLYSDVIQLATKLISGSWAISCDQGEGCFSTWAVLRDWGTQCIVHNIPSLAFYTDFTVSCIIFQLEAFTFKRRQPTCSPNKLVNVVSRFELVAMKTISFVDIVLSMTSV